MSMAASRGPICRREHEPFNHECDLCRTRLSAGIMAARIQRIGDTQDLLGESPVWDEINNCLCWIDSVAGIIRRLDFKDETLHDLRLPSPIGSIALAQNNTAIVALKQSFVLLDLATGAIGEVGSIGVTHPHVRLNDGKVDRNGAFICGTMHSSRQNGEEIVGGIYRVGADLSVTRLAEGLGTANGPCFSPSGRTMYISDSSTRQMWAYEYDSGGELGERRLFADTDQFGSGVDGATVDAEGRIWGVLVRSGKIICFEPNGRVDCIMDVPLTHPTSLCFGGPELDRLFFTSLSRSTHLKAEEEGAGGLFVIEGLDAKGLPADRFDRGTIV